MTYNDVYDTPNLSILTVLVEKYGDLYFYPHYMFKDLFIQWFRLIIYLR